MLEKLTKHVYKSVNELSEQNLKFPVLEFRLVRAIDQIELTGLIFHDNHH